MSRKELSQTKYETEEERERAINNVKKHYKKNAYKHNRYRAIVRIKAGMRVSPAVKAYYNITDEDCC